MLQRFLLFILLSVIIICSKPQEPPTFFVSALAGLKLHTSPDVNSSTITIIPFREKVTQLEVLSALVSIDGKNGRWERVQYNNVTGYVFDVYLSFFDPIEAQNKIYILRKLSELSGISIPEQNLRNAGPIAFDPNDFAIFQEMTNSNFRVISISPIGGDCNHYMGSDCFNIIVALPSRYVYSDIATDSIGKLYYMDSDIALFNYSGGEGEDCAERGMSITTGYIFLTGNIITHSVRGSSRCPDNQCPCKERIEEQSEYWSTQRSVFEPTETIKQLFNRGRH